jgi:biopolymer transport protein ExbD
MSITYREGDGEDDAMLSEINTTPLVDVMLVLLIIFLITIPVINTSVAVRLPRAANALRQNQPETVVISVDARGAAYWFDARLADAPELQNRLHDIAQKTPQPEVHIRGDARADYEAVARVLLACQQAGIARIGFVTEPPASQ